MTRPELPLDVDAALTGAIEDVLAGPRVESPDDETYEHLHYTTGMAYARSRVPANPHLDFNIVHAVARFIALMTPQRSVDAGSEHYRPTPDERNPLTALQSLSSHGGPDGSHVGISHTSRLLVTPGGLKQIDGIVSRLRADAMSRRAAAVVWDPRDTLDSANELPSTFGLFFHVRDDRLVTTVVMRSSNALVYMPYNFFEFSLLGEVVARVISKPLGRYVQMAASIHVFDTPAEEIRARAVVGVGDCQSYAMPEMPAQPIEAIEQLSVLEARIQIAENPESLAEVHDDASTELEPYWLAFFRVLAAWKAAKEQWFELAAQLANELPDYFRDHTLRLVRMEQAARGEGDGQSEDILDSYAHGRDVLIVLNDDGIESARQDTSARVLGALLPESLDELGILDLVASNQALPGEFSLDQALRISRTVRSDFTTAARDFSSDDAGQAKNTLEAQVRDACEQVRRENGLGR